MHLFDLLRRGTAGSAFGTALALALIVPALAFAAPASAQGVAPVGKPTAAKSKGARTKSPATAESAKPDGAAAEKALESGIKLYQAGKHEAAVQSLNSALQGGGLASARMARGLYYRGLAYKAQGKPAQSISDLTSALWLKGGLDDRERADAQAQRTAAYQEAGLGDAPSVRTPTAAAAHSTPAAAAPAATQAAANSSGPMSGVTGFFGNLFGGGGSTAPDAVGAANAATATGSVRPQAPTEVSSWSSETSKAAKGAAPVAAAAPAPAPAAAAKPVKVAAATPTPTPTPPPPAAAPAASGKFRLQVAAVRTRAEADAIANRLKKEFGAKLASRQPVVDEAPVGNMGTFYRVRVGPYADANEPRRLCITLRASNGFDCLVVTQ